MEFQVERIARPSSVCKPGAFCTLKIGAKIFLTHNSSFSNGDNCLLRGSALKMHKIDFKKCPEKEIINDMYVKKMRIAPFTTFFFIFSFRNICTDTLNSDLTVICDHFVKFYYKTTACVQRHT